MPFPFEIRLVFSFVLFAIYVLLPAKSTKLKNEKLLANTAESLVIWLRLDRERRKKVKRKGG